MTDTVSRIVNRLCSCGGRGPNDPKACGACLLYHCIEQDRRKLEAAEKLADASESLLREYGYREPIADAAYVLQKALNEWEAAK